MFSVDILVHVKVMGLSPLLLLLLAACIGTSVRAYELPCDGVYCHKECILVLKECGDITQGDVQHLLGVSLAVSEDSAALASISSFASQQVCKALGKHPVAGVAVGAKRSVSET